MQGFRGATPDGDAGAKPLHTHFPPRVGGRGVEQITIYQ